MKLKLKNNSSKFKNVLKYILTLQNIKYKITNSHIYFDEQDENEIKKIYKYLLKNILSEKIVNVMTKNIIVNNKPPELTVGYSANENLITLTGTITNTNNSPIIACGFNVYYVINTIYSSGNIESSTIDCTLNLDNTFDTTIDVPSECSNIAGGGFLYVLNYQAFGENSNGITYTNFYAYNYFVPCIVENTLITLYDMTKKYIQDITYDDTLLVWDFDKGEFSFSKPLWIKQEQEANEYYSGLFDNDTEFNFVNKHRIYNCEKGKFTNLFKSDSMHTITQDNQIIKLLNIKKVNKTVKYYNLITDYHMNFYANGILTSCRYNNLYPIKNMKWEKISNTVSNNYESVPEKYIRGMRLLEQTVHTDLEYINRLIINESRIHKLFHNKKILFLDHSGVMTKNIHTLEFDERNINYIREIVKNFCLEIVVSSDWTEFKSFDEIISLYKKHNINIPKDYSHKVKYNANPNYKKISVQELRANEILEWTHINNYDITDIVVIDDLDMRKFFPSDVFIWICTTSLTDHF
jgi:hypothetical protein